MLAASGPFAADCLAEGAVRLTARRDRISFLIRAGRQKPGPVPDRGRLSENDRRLALPSAGRGIVDDGRQQQLILAAV